MTTDLGKRTMAPRGYTCTEKNGSSGRRVVLKHDDTKSRVEFYVAPRSYVSNRCDLADLRSFLGHGDVIGYISRVSVPSAHRRNGIGSRLVRHTLRYLQKAYVERVFLIVDVDGERWLEKFYRQLGFRVVARARSFGMMGVMGPSETFMGTKLEG